jgi:hypothetical protein
VVVACAMQILPLYVAPLRRVLQVAPLGLDEWIVVLACAGLAAVVGQGIRVGRGRASDSPAAPQ